MPPEIDLGSLSITRNSYVDQILFTSYLTGLCGRMLYTRRCLCLRISYALFIPAFLYFVIFLKRQRPQLEQNSQRTPDSLEHESYPIYEYTSLYRIRADSEFEKSLDQKLISLEKSKRASVSENLVANYTIWQIASSKEKKTWEAWVSQWDNANPEWTHYVLTSLPDDLLEAFQSIPDIRDAMKKYPLIQKDLLRHLLLWYHGGLYAGIDTWSRVSLRECAPIASVINNSMNIGLMIGVGIDEPFLSLKWMEKWGWTRNFGFSQDLIWAPRKYDPILRYAIIRSISHARIQQELGGFADLSNVQKRQILEEISGVAMFTDVVLENLSDQLSMDDTLRDPDAGIARRVSWKNIRRLKSPIWIEADYAAKDDSISGLAILPIYVWSNGQAHSNAGSDSVEGACVNQIHSLSHEKYWRDYNLN